MALVYFIVWGKLIKLELKSEISMHAKKLQNKFIVLFQSLYIYKIIVLFHGYCFYAWTRFLNFLGKELGLVSIWRRLTTDLLSVITEEENVFR